MGYLQYTLVQPLQKLNKTRAQSGHTFLHKLAKYSYCRQEHPQSAYQDQLSFIKGMLFLIHTSPINWAVHEVAPPSLKPRLWYSSPLQTFGSTTGGRTYVRPCAKRILLATQGEWRLRHWERFSQMHWIYLIREATTTTTTILNKWPIGVYQNGHSATASKGLKRKLSRDDNDWSVPKIDNRHTHV